MTDRRTAIKNAALQGFLENGYAATTITQIGRQSGSTVGSIYHAFSGKPAIAYEIWSEGQPEDIADLMEKCGNKPRKAITAVIDHYLEWGWKNPEVYKFHHDLMARAKTDPDFAPLSAQIASQMSDCAAIYQRWVDEKLVEPHDWTTASALIFGPADHFLTSGSARNPDLAAVLANVAWQGLKPNKNGNNKKDKQNKSSKKSK